MSEQEKRRSDRVIILEGEKGKEIFEEIKNTPAPSHEELVKEVEESKKRILEKRVQEEKEEQVTDKSEAKKKKYDVPTFKFDDILSGKANLRDSPYRCCKIAKEDTERALEYYSRR